MEKSLSERLSFMSCLLHLLLHLVLERDCKNMRENCESLSLPVLPSCLTVHLLNWSYFVETRPPELCLHYSCLSLCVKNYVQAVVLHQLCSRDWVNNLHLLVVDVIFMSPCQAQQDQANNKRALLHLRMGCIFKHDSSVNKRESRKEIATQVQSSIIIISMLSVITRLHFYEDSATTASCVVFCSPTDSQFLSWE